MTRPKWIEERKDCWSLYDTRGTRLVVYTRSGLEGWFMAAYGIVKIEDYDLKETELRRAMAEALTHLVGVIGGLYHGWREVMVNVEEVK